MTRRCLVGIAAVLACSGMSVARADEAPYSDPIEQTRLSLNLDWWPSTDADVLAFDLDAQIVVSRHFAVDLQMPWAVGTLPGVGQPTAGPGNILASAYGFRNLGSNNVLWGGLTAAVPTSYDMPETNVGVSRASLLTFAAMTHDGLDEAEFLPATAGLDLFFGWGLRFKRYFHFRSELRGLLTWPVVGGTSPSEAGFQEIQELEGRFPFGLVLGVRLQFLAAFSTGFAQGVADSYDVPLPNQPLQQFSIAIEPYVGYEPEGQCLFARLALLAGTAPLNGPFSQATAVIPSAVVGYRF